MAANAIIMSYIILIIKQIIIKNSFDTDKPNLCPYSIVNILKVFFWTFLAGSGSTKNGCKMAADVKISTYYNNRENNPKNIFVTVAHSIWPYFEPNISDIFFKTFLLEFRSTKMAEEAKWPPVV